MHNLGGNQASLSNFFSGNEFVLIYFKNLFSRRSHYFTICPRLLASHSTVSFLHLMLSVTLVPPTLISLVSFLETVHLQFCLGSCLCMWPLLSLCNERWADFHHPPTPTPFNHFTHSDPLFIDRPQIPASVFSSLCSRSGD